MKEKGKKIVAQNKKARHDYAISDVIEAGIVLVGTEVKSLRQGRASLVDGFAHLKMAKFGYITFTFLNTMLALGQTMNQGELENCSFINKKFKN
jgi:tmRNA-binding protein